MELKGKVKNYEENQYSAGVELGEPVKMDLHNKHIYQFDNKGNIIAQFDKTESGMDKINFMYDSDGNLVVEVSDNYRLTFYYVDGHLREKRLYNIGDLEGLELFKYDPKGNLSQKYEYRVKTLMIMRALSEEVRLHDDISFFYFKYRHDEKGNLVEESQYNETNDLLNCYIFKYDEHGIKIEDNISYPKRVFTYDEKGRCEGHCDWSGDTMVEITKYKYDEYNNIIEDIRIILADLNIREQYFWKYFYDETGNWIKKIDYNENLEPTLITERKIEYYQS